MSTSPFSSSLTTETWWDIVPGRTDGATPLLNRCSRILGWNEDFTQRVLFAYRDFIECKMFARDYDATKLSPSIPVDQMWHQHVLDTRNYASDCQLLAEGMLHHNPDGDLDQETRAKRIQATMNAIRLKTGDEELDPEIWHFGSVAQENKTKNRNGKRKLDRDSKGDGNTKRSRSEEIEIVVEEKKDLRQPSTRAASRAATNAIHAQYTLSQRQPSTRAASRAATNAIQAQCNISQRQPSTRAASRAATNAIQAQYNISQRQPSTRGASRAATNAIQAAIMLHEPIVIRVRDNITGEEIFFKILPTTKMSKLFRSYAARNGVTPSNLRFFFHGQRVDPGQTALFLNIKNRDALDVVQPIVFGVLGDTSRRISKVSILVDTEASASNGNETMNQITDIEDDSQVSSGHVQQRAGRDDAEQTTQARRAPLPRSARRVRPNSADQALTIRARNIIMEDFIYFRVKPTTTMQRVFTAYANRMGLPEVTYRFLANGTEILPADTPRSLNLQDQDAISVRIRDIVINKVPRPFW